MKRMMMTVMILSALLASALTGCGNDSSDTTAAPAVTVTTTEATTEAATEATETTTDSSEATADAQTTAAEDDQLTSTPAAETPEAQAAVTEKPAESAEASDVLSEAQMKEASKKLIQEYVSLYDGIVCGAVQVDGSDAYSPNPERPYFHVTDSKYQSIADLKNALANTLSGSEYDKMINLMLEDTVPIYVEQEGKLYTLSVGRGSAYSDTWCWDELQFTNVTANSFTVTAKYIHIGDTVITQSFDIVNTEGGFRINNASETRVS